MCFKFIIIGIISLSQVNSSDTLTLEDNMTMVYHLVHFNKVRPSRIMTYTKTKVSANKGLLLVNRIALLPVVLRYPFHFKSPDDITPTFGHKIVSS